MHSNLFRWRQSTHFKERYSSTVAIWIQTHKGKQKTKEQGLSQVEIRPEQSVHLELKSHV